MYSGSWKTVGVSSFFVGWGGVGLARVLDAMTLLSCTCVVIGVRVGMGWDRDGVGWGWDNDDRLYSHTYLMLR